MSYARATHDYPEPRISCTRTELVDAISQCTAHTVVRDGHAFIVADSMADAIIEALRWAPHDEGTSYCTGLPEHNHA